MTNIVAIWLFVFLAGAIALDLLLGWGGTLIFLRKLLELINQMVFWR